MALKIVRNTANQPVAPISRTSANCYVVACRSHCACVLFTIRTRLLDFTEMVFEVNNNITFLNDPNHITNLVFICVVVSVVVVQVW
jgi:hypothetical protein